METDSSMEESFSEDIASDKEPPKELVSSAEEPCETEAASEELSERSLSSLPMRLLIPQATSAIKRIASTTRQQKAMIRLRRTSRRV